MTKHFNAHEIGPPALLSSAGRRRRDAMLAELQGAVVRTARRRRAMRAAVAAAPPALALAVAFTFLRPSPAPSPTFVHNPQPPAPQTSINPHIAPPVETAQPLAAVMHHADFKVIDAPPSARIVTAAPAHVRIISDDELIDALRAAGHDVGLIRTPDRVILTNNTPDDDAGSRAADPPLLRASGSV